MTIRKTVCGLVLVMGLASCGGSASTTVTTTQTATGSATSTVTEIVKTVTKSAAHASSPAYFSGAVGGAQMRPAVLNLTGDGTLDVSQVRWTSWGGPVAVGVGLAQFHGCTPSCAAARAHVAAVTTRLSQLRVCSGRRYYAHVTLVRRSGRLLYAGFLSRSWAPC